MQRGMREKKELSINSFRKRIYIASGITIIGAILIIIGFVVYGNSLNNKAKESALDSKKIAELVPVEEEIEDASSSFGKTVEESQEQTIINENTNKADKEEETAVKNKPTTTTKTQETKKNTSEVNAKTEEPKNDEKEKTANPVFTAPVVGEIIKEFATDTLVYSATLEEWITHNGIDIKAEKTTVVKAAADGTVKTIKNDPRYGLTVIIEHANGFKTVYANLLTSEFVSEGEKVTSGQSIGTIGNTATFEIADEAHLHFEMLKDDEYVDPGVYMK